MSQAASTPAKSPAPAQEVLAPEMTDAGAVAAARGLACWILTDGKAGDRAHALGIAERLGLAIEERQVAPRAPWSWLMPHLWRIPGLAIDPREAPGRPGSPLAAPLPDLVIASGRRAAAYLPAIKAASGGRCFTAFLKDPRTGPAIADFLWVPEHDRLRGPNVMTTLLSPHRFTPERLAAAAAAPPAPLKDWPGYRVALLLGGNSKDFTFTEADISGFLRRLDRMIASGAVIRATPSRRTPPSLLEAVRGRLARSGGWIWDGAGENPYPALLACSEAIIVTADSVNMVGEALATGRPVHLVRPSGGSRKIDRFLTELEEIGATCPFFGRPVLYSYEPMDATPAIATALARHLTEFRSRLLRQSAWSHP
ncbi:MAG: mitochondrial fission ELM1 family protein [Beijerinckiaceae bacterium]|nr:mitochondrial fission ELM1 family protein [Beijerinckiaceae bacterium]MCZ8301099.1 mitochondrial fission ELM1 family protein [Beijerinckiaceae bacterium]